MVVATALAALIGFAVGTFLQLVVFDLADQQLLSDAGRWGSIAGFLFVAFMILPSLAGVALGTRARRLGEVRRGTIGMVVNALIAAMLLVSGVANLLLG